MARVGEFNEEKAFAALRDVFWEHGCEASYSYRLANNTGSKCG